MGASGLFSTPLKSAPEILALLSEVYFRKTLLLPLIYFCLFLWQEDPKLRTYFLVTAIYAGARKDKNIS